MASRTLYLQPSQHSNNGTKPSNREPHYFSYNPILLQAKRCRVKHYRVAELLEAIKQQGNQYFIAIRNSVETANDGVAFAQDAQALCEMLTSGKHKTHELKAFLDSMIDIAAKAHKRSVVTKELFTKVRRELFEV